VSAVVGFTLGDCRPEGKRGRLRLMEKGDKEKLVWLPGEARNSWMDISRRPASRTQSAIIPGARQAHRLTGDAITRRDRLRVVKQNSRTSHWTMLVPVGRRFAQQPVDVESVGPLAWCDIRKEGGTRTEHLDGAWIFWEPAAMPLRIESVCGKDFLFSLVY
jgi:hypothetical protein